VDLSAPSGGGLTVALGDGATAVAAGPLAAFLLPPGADPGAVLPRLRPYLLGAPRSLDLERTGAGLVLHNVG
jgi:hypothetical protein